MLQTNPSNVVVFLQCFKKMKTITRHCIITGVFLIIL